MDTTDQIESLLAAAFSDSGPGCALAVATYDDCIICTRGYADLAHRIPITRDTVFHVASVSKQFVAYCCALLAEEGQLDLDGPVSLLPRISARITPRDLIHHISGIRDQWDLLLLSGRRLEDVITQEDVLHLARLQEALNFEPGTSFSYCNTGYTILAKLLEDSGMSLREFARANIFAPLNMTSSVFVDDHQEIVPRSATSYYRRASGDSAVVHLAYGVAGATNLKTTVDDLAQWCAALMSPPFLRVFRSEAKLRDGTPLDYGYGVWHGRTHGRRFFEHSGSDAGYRAHLVVFPDDRVATIALANHAECPVYRLAHAAAELVLGADVGGRRLDSPDVRAARPSVPTEAPVEGLYVEPASGTTRDVAFDGTALTLGFDTYEREATGIYRSLDGRSAVSFESPTVIRLKVAGMLDHDFSATKRWTPSSAELRRCEGAYWSRELASLWMLERRGTALVLNHPRWGMVDLVPTVDLAFAGEISHPPLERRIDLAFDLAGHAMFATTDRAHRVRFEPASRP